MTDSELLDYLERHCCQVTGNGHKRDCYRLSFVSKSWDRAGEVPTLREMVELDAEDRKKFLEKTLDKIERTV